MLPTDPILISLQAITGLSEPVSEHDETSGRVRLVARPMMVSLDRVAQHGCRAHRHTRSAHRARAVTGIGTDQLWAALQSMGRGHADGDGRVVGRHQQYQ